MKFEVSFLDGFERLIIAILIEKPRNLDCFSPTRSTPPKTNMAPENGPLEKEIPIGNLYFLGVCVSFLGVTIFM